MLTTQDPTPPEKAELFAKKIGLASPYTHRTHLISHHPTSFSSDIWNIVCRESLFHHVKNYLQQFMKSSRPSRHQPWRTCFRWLDSQSAFKDTDPATTDSFSTLLSGPGRNSTSSSQGWPKDRHRWRRMKVPSWRDRGQLIIDPYI
jgi:hypothetical protein